MSHESVPPPVGPTVLRPSWKAYVQDRKNNAALLVVLMVFVLFQATRNAWMVPVIAVTAVLAIAGVALYFTRASIEILGDGRYRVTSPVGSREFAAAEVTTGVTFSQLHQFATAAVHRLAVAGASGKTLFRRTSGFWSADDIDLLARDLVAHGAPLRQVTEPVQARQVYEHDPYAITWMEARPLLAAMILSFAILVVVIVAVVVVVA